MNEAFLQRALKIIEALTPEELESSMAEYGIEFTRKYTFFEDVPMDFGAQDPVIAPVMDLDAKLKSFVNDLALDIDYSLISPVQNKAVNDDSYMMAA
ncbi:hypothetical protein [Undibacterium sp. WLX3042]|uniref:hypothetical protein n=1 Tax=Undibacterium sp. WLX3042 TaxID=3412686 RepID=UPI003C2D1B9B